MDGRVLSSTLRASLQKYLHAPLGLAMYRHLAIGFMEKLLQRKKFDDGDLFDEQAGHTAETAATVYARSNIDHRYLSEDGLFEYYQCSKKWHELLGLISPSATKTTQTSSSKVIQQIHHGDQVIQSTMCSTCRNLLNGHSQSTVPTRRQQRTNQDEGEKGNLLFLGSII